MDYHYRFFHQKTGVFPAEQLRTADLTDAGQGARFEASVGAVDAGQGAAQAVRGQAGGLGDLTIKIGWCHDFQWSFNLDGIFSQQKWLFKYNYGVFSMGSLNLLF